MSRVTVNITSKLRRIYAVRDGTTIGRDSACQIHLLNNSVSRIHARFEVSGEDVRIVDLASANGVRVNGKRVKKSALTDGDEVKVGKIAMFFEAAKGSIAEENVFHIKADTDVRQDTASVKNINSVRLVAQTNRDALDRLMDVAESYIRSRKGFSDYDAELLCAAMREAVSNAERHGNRNDSEKFITITFHDSMSDLRMICEDEGPGFDFAAVLEQSREGDAVSAARRSYKRGKVGGLGIRLLLNAADIVNYSQNGSCVEIVKRKHKGMFADDTQLEEMDSGLVPEPVDANPAAGFAVYDPDVPQTVDAEVATFDIEADNVGHIPVADVIETDVPIPSLTEDAPTLELAQPVESLGLPKVAYEKPSNGEIPLNLDRDSDTEEYDESILEDLELIERAQQEDGGKELHSTTWYIRQVEKKRKSGRQPTLDDLLEEEEKEE